MGSRLPGFPTPSPHTLASSLPTHVVLECPLLLLFRCPHLVPVALNTVCILPAPEIRSAVLTRHCLLIYPRRLFLNSSGRLKRYVSQLNSCISSSNPQAVSLLVSTPPL